MHTAAHDESFKNKRAKETNSELCMTTPGKYETGQTVNACGTTAHLP